MKKFILLFLLLFSYLNASVINHELFRGESSVNQKIILETKIIKNILNSFEVKPLLYITNRNYGYLFEKYTIVENCEMATIAYVKKGDDSCDNSKAKVIENSYSSALRNDNAIGAFYWRKGRPNIVLFGERIKSLKVLNQDILKYVE